MSVFIFNLPIMSGDGVIGVAIVPSKFDSETFAASNLMSLHSSQELGTLTSEHGSNDKFDATMRGMMQGVRRSLAGEEWEVGS